MKIDWKPALDLETKVAKIIHQQEVNGVNFDLERAKKYVKLLENNKKALYKDIRPHLKTEVSIPYDGKEITNPFLKSSGLPVQRVCSWMGDQTHLVSGPFTRVEFVEPDLGSRQKLIKQLLSFGWKPKIFTPKGQPKLTEKGEPVSTLSNIQGGIGELIAKWYVYQHRQSQIMGWIRDVRDDGRIPASADSCGTNTARMRHRTLVNVPKAKPHVLFGYEMRSLFMADEGCYLVGYDASALEACMEAHYTWPYDDGAYARELLKGDVHSKNAKIFEVDRDTAKNGKYGLVYGAQPPKLAQTLGCSRKKGQFYFDDFWEKNPSLKTLNERVKRMARKLGYLIGIDGRKLYVRSEHSALNLLFQSAGAIVMKMTMVLLDEELIKRNIKYKKAIDMHDESQANIKKEEVLLYEVDTEEELKEIYKKEKKEEEIWMSPRCVDGVWRGGYSEYGELAIKSIQKAGTILGVRCPLNGEYIIGTNWAETH